MADELLPKGEKLRRAVRWIDAERAADPERSLGRLVADATLRFDLSPREGELLLDFYARQRERDG